VEMLSLSSPRSLLCLFPICRLCISEIKDLAFQSLARFLARNSCCRDSKSLHLVMCGFRGFGWFGFHDLYGSWRITVAI
jgi:hypothetical protein